MRAEVRTSEPVADVWPPEDDVWPPEDDAPAQQPVATDRRPARRPPASQDDEGWLENWQRNEIRWLRGEVERMERRLWWRTVILGSATGLAVLVAAALVLIALRDPEPSPLVAQAGSPLPTLPARAPSEIAASDRPAEDAGRLSAAALPEAQAAAPLEQVPDTEPEEESRAPAQLINAVGGADAEALRAAVIATENYIKQLEAIVEQESGPPESRAGLADPRPEAQSPGGSDGRSAAAASGPRAAPAAGAGAAPGEHPAPAPIVVRPQATPGASPGAAARDDAPTSDAPTLYTATIQVNLRAEPRGDAAVLTVLNEGDVVRGFERQGSWLRVRLVRPEAGDLTGFVYSRYLRPVAAPS